jgi:beta-lactamase class A
MKPVLGSSLLFAILLGMSVRESMGQETNSAPFASIAAVTLEQRAQETGKLFCAHPSGLETLFAPSFLQAVPPAQVTALLQQLYQTAGACTKVTLLEAKGPNEGTYQLDFEKGFVATSVVVIEPQAPNRITGFLIKGLVPALKSFDEVIGEMKKLPGQTALTVARLTQDGPQPIASLQPDAELALGSSFKLYVLSELVREIDAGTRKWDDIVPLDATSRSLPSGSLHAWPVGSPLTLHTLAALMISQSDNTATDELIHTLGREKIESILPVAGMKNPARNTPFFTTLEIFQLKGSALGADYLKLASVDQRRAFLAGPLLAIARDQINLPAQPAYIDSIEWFATTNDLCRVMSWLSQATAKPSTSPAKDILQINPGLPLDKKPWSYIGYKGGSETGVLNFTYWLTNQKGESFAVAATWNNPAASVDEVKFGGLMQRAIDLLGAP